MNPRATVSRIYKEDHFTLRYPKFESSGPNGFEKEDFFAFFLRRPKGGARMDARSMVGGIYT